MSVGGREGKYIQIPYLVSLYNLTTNGNSHFCIFPISGYLSRVAYPNTPPRAELGMSDKSLRYLSGCIKTFFGEKNSLSKKSHNQGKLPVNKWCQVPSLAYVFDVLAWVMAWSIYLLFAPGLGSPVRLEFCH
jgi:hypothetical protein